MVTICKIYEVDFTAQSYKMNMIESIQEELEIERTKRSMLIKKYVLPDVLPDEASPEGWLGLWSQENG